MCSMATGEHIHIISAGESIHKTYPVSINQLENITRTYVIVEDDIFYDDDSDSERLKATKPKIREAINTVQQISKVMGIPCKIQKIDAVTFNAIRDVVLDIYAQYPIARFSFNISGGTKPLSIGLFVMSVWLDGEAFHTPGEKVAIQKLSIPKMHVKDISTNPNYVQILKLLNPYGDEGLLRKLLQMEFSKRYVPVRERGEKKTKRVFNSAILSKYLSSLEGWNLVQERYKSGNKKEKIYSITSDGILALRFIEIRETKSD